MEDVIRKAPIFDNPVLVDSVMSQIQDELLNGLPWLNAAYGRCQRLVKEYDGRKVYTPNVYIGGVYGHGKNEYMSLLPDSKIGNFSFFVIHDPQIFEWMVYQQIKEVTPFSLIFWFDTRTINNKDTDRNTEYIKNKIIYILNGRDGGWHLKGGKLIINKVYERVENIYQGFSINEVDNQFLMHPYAGFRMDGEIKIDTPCIL